MAATRDAQALRLFVYRLRQAGGLCRFLYLVRGVPLAVFWGRYIFTAEGWTGVALERARGQLGNGI